MAEYTRTSGMWAESLAHGFHTEDYTKLVRLFNGHATSSGGAPQLSRDGLTSAFEELGVVVARSLQDLLFQTCDVDDSGLVSFEEFLKAMKHLIHGDDDDILITIFQLYDQDNSGFIDGSELRAFVEVQNNLAKSMFSASYQNVTDDFRSSTRQLLEEAGACLPSHHELSQEQTQTQQTRLSLQQFLQLMKRRSGMFEAGTVSHRALVCDVLKLSDSVYDHLHGIYERHSNAQTNLMVASDLKPAMADMGIDVVQGLSDHLFAMFDKDSSGEIRFEEFAAGVVGLIRGQSEAEKLMLFQLVDADNTGYIEGDELRTLVQIQSKLSAFVNDYSDEQVEETVQAIMQSFDDVSDNRMSYAEFRAFMKTHARGTALNG